jgi:hypothetical protein
VKRAAVIEDAYSTMDGPTIDDALERWLGTKIETPAARVVQALRRGIVPAGDDISTASSFVAFQMVRGPSFRRRLTQLASALGPLLFATMATSRAGKKSPDLFPSDRELDKIARQIMELAPPEVGETGKDADLREVVRGADMLARALANMHWSVAVATHRELITGDSPAILRSAHGDFFAGPQLLPKDHEVILPASPFRLLIVSPFPTLGPHARLTHELASQVNDMLVRGCDSAVYHHLDMPCSVVPLMPAHPEPLPNPKLRFSQKLPGPPSSGQSIWPELKAPFREALELLGGDPPLDD